MGGSGSVIALGLVASIALAATASAQDTEALGRAAFEEGVAAAREYRWEDARAAFERADALVVNANVRINLAAALVRTGRLRAAAELYRRVLAEHADAIADRRAQVEEALASVERRLPTLHVELGNALPDDVVELDGEEVAIDQGRFFARVDPGEHTIRVRRGARVAAERTVGVEEGRTLRVLLAVDGAALSAEPSAEPLVVREPNWAAIGMTAGGVAVLAGLLYPWIRLNDIMNDPRFIAARSVIGATDDACVANARPGGPMDAYIAALCREGNALVTAQWVLIAVGGAAIVTGVALFIALGAEIVRGVRVAPFVVPGAGGVLLAGRLP